MAQEQQNDGYEALAQLLGKILTKEGLELHPEIGMSLSALGEIPLEALLSDKEVRGITTSKSEVLKVYS